MALMLQLLAIVAIAAGPPSTSPPRLDIWAIDRERILKAANAALRHEPVTVTAASSPRTAGGLHDYFSEADYWSTGA
jgi:Tfp pilus assembly protein PilX